MGATGSKEDGAAYLIISTAVTCGRASNQQLASGRCREGEGDLAPRLRGPRP